MAMIFNGTSQGAYMESGIDVETAVWAVGAWVKRTDFSDLGTVLGAIRPTGFRRESSCVVRDSDGIVASSCYSDGSDVFSGTVAFPADEWILILRIKPSASGGDWVTIVGSNTINTNNPYIGTPTRFAWAHSRASDENTRFTPMKAAHLMVWTDTIPDEDSITQLRAGMIPSEIDVPPTIYEPAISSVSGAITTFGTPTFDSDDPLVSAPSINPTGTTTSASPGGAFTVNLSNMDGRTVASLELYDPASGVSTAQSYTGTTSLTGTVTLGNLPYRSGMEWVVTLDNAAELTAEFEMVPAAGRSITNIEADFDETDQSIGYGFDPALEVGSQLEYATDTLTVYPDALFYTDYEGSQVVNHWSPTEGEWYQETIITGDLPSEVNDMFKLPTMAIPAMKIPTMRIP